MHNNSFKRLDTGALTMREAHSPEIFRELKLVKMLYLLIKTDKKLVNHLNN